MRSMVLGWNVIFQPLGALADSLMFSAGAVPVLLTVTGTVLSLPAVARALSRPSRPASDSLGWPVMSSATLALALAPSAAILTATG